MPRDEFSTKVKLRLAQRAGYQCSLCNKLTVGPSDEAGDQVNSTGEAAHITAAAPGPGARRYDKTLTPEQRASIDNGIWLCAYHADLIDGDEITYTTSYLKTVKKNHEEKIKYKQAGLNVDIGLITKIEIYNFGKIVSSPIEFELKLNNVIIGRNTTGKTLICELIGAFSNRKFLKRWENKKNSGNSYFKITFFKYELQAFKICSNHNKKISFIINDKEASIFIPPFKPLFLHKPFFYSENQELIEMISQYFEIEKYEFKNLIDQMSTFEKFLTSDFIVNEQNDLEVKLRGGLNFVSFGALSESERTSVIIEIGLCMARFYSNHTSTILIIDNAILSAVDNSGINNLMKVISEKNFTFQTIINLVDRPQPFEFYDFKVVRLGLDDGRTIVL